METREKKEIKTTRFKKAVFLELFGKGHFFDTDKPTNTSRYTTIPINVNYIVGKKRSGLEAGLGITPCFTFHSVSGSSKNVMLGGFANVNYRLQPMKEGLLFRFGFTPYVDQDDFEPLYISASIGYSFR